MNRIAVLVFALILSADAPRAWGEEMPSVSPGQKTFDEAVARMEEGDFDAAAPLLEKAVALDKELAAAYYALAVCQARKKVPDTAQARRRHNEAVALGFQRNEWLETYCDELDKKAAQPKQN